MRTLDFNIHKSEVLTLEELGKTYQETYPSGEPVGGIFHATLIESILDIFGDHLCEEQLERVKVVAVNNRDRYRPGVTIVPATEEKYGKGSIESHILRRIACTIPIEHVDSIEADYRIALSWHQVGFSIGIGPCVTVCENGCILGADRIVSSYSFPTLTGKTPSMKLPDIMNKLKEWHLEYEGLRDKDMTRVEQLQKTVMSYGDGLQIFGSLLEKRVIMDASNNIHENIVAPLKQNQINKAMTTWIEMYQKKPLTLWDMMNILNYDIKPDRTDMPSLLPQQVALAEIMEIYRNHLNA